MIKFNFLLTAKVVMHDPFAMRPFFGYNFGDYLKHWLSMEKQQSNAKVPKIFHVNWFRKNENGGFIWPGFGENARVLDWICRRVDGEDCADKSAIGYVPKLDSINVDGLDAIDMQSLFHIPKDFWQQEVEEIQKYFKEQVNSDMPDQVMSELQALRQRVNDMS